MNPYLRLLLILVLMALGGVFLWFATAEDETMRFAPLYALSVFMFVIVFLIGRTLPQ